MGAGTSRGSGGGHHLKIEDSFMSDSSDEGSFIQHAARDIKRCSTADNLNNKTLRRKSRIIKEKSFFQESVYERP